MNITLKSANSSYGGSIQKIGLKRASFPKKSGMNSTTSFTGLLPLQKNNYYCELDKIAQKIDGVLGDNFFTKTAEKAQIDIRSDKVNIPSSTLLGDIVNTIKYPFCEMPYNIANSLIKFLQKNGFDSMAQKLSNNKKLAQRLQTLEAQKNYNLVLDMLDSFCEKSEIYDIDKSAEIFKDKITNGITKIPKNYCARDERTLNRIATSTVSAIYSSADFYNISMLEKDNKKEAKKSQKGRLKQELTRMAISGALTFFTLGALDKLTKASVVANASVIALSALIAEVVSRSLNGVPLHPLSPKEAEKISKIRKEKQAKAKQNQDTQATPDTKEKTSTSLAFKNKHAMENELYKKFTNKNGELDVMEVMSTNLANEQQPKESKFKLKKVLTYGFTIASLAYMFKKVASGEFVAKLRTAKIASYSSFGANNKKSISWDSPEGKKVKQIITKMHKKQNRIDVFGKLKKLLTTKKDTVDLVDLVDKLEKLKSSKEGASIACLLDEYIEHARALINTGKSTISSRKDRFLIPGVYDGITKIFGTIYKILSIPAIALNKILDNVFFNNANKTLADFEKHMRYIDPSRYEDELAAMKNLLQKRGITNEKIVNHLKKHTRNFEISPETSELANISRTMVTAITTYFFVNDYQNKVLIESAGKNVSRAREERNERIAHKMSNFVINGTLMNLFNSVFKVPLNNSLIQATGIAAATEVTNEFLVRKSICQPIRRMKSRDAIVKYEEKKMNQGGLIGWYHRMFAKITGKKSLTQKSNVVKTDKPQEQNNKKNN